MAYTTLSWVPGALVRFGALEFVVTLDRGLERVHVPASVTPAIDDIVEAFHILRAPSVEVHAPTPLRLGEPAYEQALQ